jgi:hypothetical protein
MNKKANQLREDLLSTRNSIDIALLIINSNADNLLATALEEIYQKAQFILDDHCVVKYKIDHVEKES